MMEADVVKTQARNDRPKRKGAQRLVTQRDHPISCLIVHSWKHGGTKLTGTVGGGTFSVLGGNIGEMVI
jgi:hypothetical protein